MSLSITDMRVALGGREVVRGVSFAAHGGALIGVLGPNGAGKSTLVRGLLSLVPAGGAASIDGVAAGSMTRAEMARRIAYLPQGQTLHWPLTVERLVGLGRLPHLAPLSRMGAGDEAAVRRAMALAEVEHLATRTATELSGGERARVLIARALAVEAPVLIADEPLASLDPEHQLQGMALLRQRATEGGLVLAVLHDLSLAERFCDRVLVLHEGRLVADGAPDAVLTAALLAEVYHVRVACGANRLGALERLP